jgi:uncharacterized protein
MADLSLQTHLFAAVVAVLIGLSKCGIPGVGILLVPVMAMLFEARQSVGVLLPMLIMADVLALGYYRRHVQWGRILILFPFVAVGIGGAWGVLHALRDAKALFAPILGSLVLGMLALDVIRMRFGWERLPHHPLFKGGVGFLAGFSTTLGNAAGAIMNLYLLCHDLKKHEFMGTSAWFFFIVNCSKVPVFLHQGMITAESLRFNLWMIPGVVAGSMLGRWLLPRLSQRGFRNLVMILAAIAAVHLILS